MVGGSNPLGRGGYRLTSYIGVTFGRRNVASNLVIETGVPNK
jgi:hypothetical protein